jgi:hypothetical protein
MEEEKQECRSELSENASSGCGPYFTLDPQEDASADTEVTESKEKPAKKAPEASLPTPEEEQIPLSRTEEDLKLAPKQDPYIGSAVSDPAKPESTKDSMHATDQTKISEERSDSVAAATVSKKSSVAVAAAPAQHSYFCAQMVARSEELWGGTGYFEAAEAQQASAWDMDIKNLAATVELSDMRRLLPSEDDFGNEFVTFAQVGHLDSTKMFKLAISPKPVRVELDISIQGPSDDLILSSDGNFPVTVPLACVIKGDYKLLADLDCTVLFAKFDKEGRKGEVWLIGAANGPQKKEELRKRQRVMEETEAEQEVKAEEEVREDECQTQ